MIPLDHDLGIQRLQPGNSAEAATSSDPWQLLAGDPLRLQNAYDRLLADLPVPICRITRRGQIIHANRHAAQLLGFSPAELAGMTLHEFGADDTTCRQLERAALIGGLDSGRQEVRRQWLRAKHQPIHVDLHFAEVLSLSGLDKQWMVALINQTHLQQEHDALHQALEALRQANDANQELALVADRSHNMIMICDADRHIRWVNPSFTRITGYSLAEVLGRPPSPLFEGPETDPEVLESINARLARGEAVERVTVRQYRKDGHAYWAEISIQPVRCDQGRISRYIAIGQDITDQLQAQAEREALLRAEASHAIKSEFLSRMSHNMRTPLNAVLGFSQLLSMSQDPGLPDAHRQKLDIIHKAGKQLLSLVDQALQLAQLEHHAEPCEARRVDLLPLLTDCVDMLKDKAASQHKHIVLEASPCAAWAEPQRVREVALNLLSNAIKYSQSGRNIWLRCAPLPDQGQVYIEVQDQGVGINADALPLIFQPFTRLDATRNMASGHGLGLAISRRQAQLMNGDLIVNSLPGQGSVFRMILPADTGPVESSRADPAGTPEQYMPHLPDMHLLYVEDNAMNRSLVESVLAAYPQVQVELAASVAEGMAAIRRSTPDVMLLDINLPDGCGLDICRAMRSDLDRAQPLLIALSADALPQHISAAMEAGFDEYLVKPLQIHRLLDVLSTAQQVRLSMASKH